MYGLQNILTEQEVTLEQQCMILELFLSAQCFNTLNLVISLQSSGFTEDESNHILAHTLHAVFLRGDHFDPHYLLKSLSTEENHLKEKTRRWFDSMAKRVFIEQYDIIQAHMTPPMLQAFAPQPPKPAYDRYDTVIVMDSDEQPIMDGLDYFKHLLDTCQITTGKIIIPARLTPQHSKTNATSGMNATFRHHLPSYLKCNDLHSHVTQDDHLSRDQLGDFLVGMYSREPDIKQSSINIYHALYKSLRTNRTLIITTEDQIGFEQNTINLTYEALHNDKIEIDVIYTLKRKDFTPSDLARLLIERFCQEPTPDITAAATAAAIGETTTFDGSTQTRAPSLTLPAIPSSALGNSTAAAARPARPNNHGLIAMGLAAVGVFAASNPEVTAGITEAAKELAQAAMKSMFN